VSVNQKVNILMVDDQPAKLLSYEAILSDLGENLIRAASAKEALDFLLRQDVAVLLSDVNMPDLDGFELVDLIRSHPRFERVAVIFVSGVHLSAVDRLKGYQHGAVDYITVPLIPEILRAKVRVFVELYRKSKALENVNARLEERVRERTGALAASEERFRLATDAMSGGLYDWDVASDAWWTSKGLAALVGYDDASEPMGGTRSWWGTRLHSDDLEHGWREVESALRADAPAFDVQYRVRRREDRWVWVWDRGRIVRDSAGRAIRVVGHVTDVSAQKDAEEALQAAHQRKDEFIATLSHELRNPLAPIRNALHLWRLNRESGSTSDRELEVIERHVDQLRRLVDDLLDITRISKNVLTLRSEKMNLTGALNAAVEANQPLLEERGHHLTVIAPPGLPVVGDFARLTQVVTNLLNNSAKYTPNGGQISLTAETRGDQLARIVVKDNGRGIDQRELSRLFQMFYRAGGSSPYLSDGLGVGLALAARIVEMHGGRIEARSDGAGAGSEFVVELPLLSEPDVTRKVQDREGEASPDRAAVRKVLVADDSRDNAMTLATFLELKGYEVRTAFDGLQALEVGAEFLPDAVLLDIGMPVLDGYDAALRMRKETWGQSALLICQSGWTQEKDRSRSKEVGFDAHLGKPLDLEMLTNLLGAPRGPRVATRRRSKSVLSD
jgi:PAS domain S-box-containing protein